MPEPSTQPEHSGTLPSAPETPPSPTREVRADAASYAGLEGPALPPSRGLTDLPPDVAELAEAAAAPKTPAPPGQKPRHPLVEMLLIAAPTVVTMTSYTVMQFIDGFMVSRATDQVTINGVAQAVAGDQLVAAQGNGGMTVWLAMSMVLGLTGVINTYVSQNLGAGRPERGPAYAWNGLWLSAFAAILMIPYGVALLPHIYAWLGHEQPLRTLETQYATILCYGAFLTLGARSLSHFFYGIHKPTIIMVCALLANVLNIFLNAMLIYGRDGVPADWAGAGILQPATWLARTIDLAPMGVTGAALGTVIGSGIELVIPLGVFLGPGMNRAFKTRAAWRLSAPHLRDILKIGWPAALMFLNEMLCWGYLMSGLLPKAGEAAGEDPVLHNTAGWIALRYMHLSFMPAMGMSIAVTAIVGKCMGMGRPDLAAKRAWLGLSVTLAYMGLCALAFVALREQMVRVFVDDGLEPERIDALVRIGASVMIAAAVFQLFDALAITLSGALRGAGDTIWPGVVTVILAWTCIIGLGHLLIDLAPHLGSLGPWIGASLYIMALGSALLWRFGRGKWKSIKLVDADAKPTA
ncbi:MAG: MATE family efflux transporter [Phycisphaerales bacterium]